MVAACQYANDECAALKSDNDFENLTASDLIGNWPPRKMMSQIKGIIGTELFDLTGMFRFKEWLASKGVQSKWSFFS